MNLRYLEELCALPGVSGHEDAVRDWIELHLPADCSYRTDRLGNLIVTKAGAKAPCFTVLFAHMDEVGFIVTDTAEDGFLHFDTVGGIDKQSVIGKRLQFGERIGVVGIKPTHLCKGAEGESIPDIPSMYIDMAGETSIERGDVLTFPVGFTRFGEGYIRSKALDDRLGCLSLLELLCADDLPYALTCVFSAREEIGGAAAGAAYALRPDSAIVAETTTAADLPTVEGAERVCALGKGAVVPFMDKGTLYPKHLYDLAYKTAAANSIPIQTKTKIAGGNDARGVTASGCGVPTITVSVPCRYLHGPSVVAKESDCEAASALIRLLWERMSAGDEL
ncbi:MAG: M42 family peptidase [Oscillospiraceae bacterium]|jgi:endoglucanase|nr:M42 family peptidase [Oscillospiraceae bacterium]